MRLPTLRPQRRALAFAVPDRGQVLCRDLFADRAHVSRYAAMIRFMIRVIVALALAMPAAAMSADLPTRTITIRDQKLVVEVAATPQARASGLMHRFSLRQDHGMLFVFEKPQPLAFYMKNTYIPLSIAFVDAQGRIVNIEDMRPMDESTHWSRGMALYAIEMRQGWFAAKGIAAGDIVEGLR